MKDFNYYRCSVRNLDRFNHRWVLDSEKSETSEIFRASIYNIKELISHNVLKTKQHNYDQAVKLIFKNATDKLKRMFKINATFQNGDVSQKNTPIMQTNLQISCSGLILKLTHYFLFWEKRVCSAFTKSRLYLNNSERLFELRSDKTMYTKISWSGRLFIILSYIDDVTFVSSNKLLLRSTIGIFLKTY